MTKTDLRRIRLRFLVAPLLVLACALFCSVYIRKTSSTYDYPLTGFGDAVITADDVSVEPPTMARVLDVHKGPDGVYVATIEGLERDSGFLMVNLENQGGMSQLRVDRGLVVVADGANFEGWEALPASVALCFAVSGILCIWALQELRRNAWYGYEMASYAGGALFCLVQAAIFGSLLFVERKGMFTDFALAVTSLADTFVSLTLAPMAFASLFVCASNVVLLRREGYRPINALGIVASLAWAAACMALRGFDVAIEAADNMTLVLLWYVLDSVFAIGLCYALALLAGTCTCAWGAALHVPEHPRDYLMILGCGLRPDGTPTPLLAGRVDAALTYAQEQEAACGVAATFVPSGGKGPDEACAEAESMRRYLVSKGVDDQRILLEDQSTSTRENFSLSAKVIAANGGADRPVAFATTNYHVFRGYVYAHDAGLDAEGIAAPTRLYFWPNAFLREFVGLLVSRWLPTLISYLTIAAIYLAVEYALLLSFG